VVCRARKATQGAIPDPRTERGTPDQQETRSSAYFFHHGVPSTRRPFMKIR
jgi:hypothetical protein